MDVQAVLNALRIPYLLFDAEKELLASSLSDYLNQNLHKEGTEFQQLIDQVIQEKKLVFTPVTLRDSSKLFVQCTPVFVDRKLTGVLCTFQGSLFEDEELDEYRNLSLDLQTIFDSSYDVIYVSDGKGITLRVSSACEWLWGKKPEELIGRSVYELEQEGVFTPSVTRLVLEKGERVTMLQKTRTGRNLLVLGTPVKNKNGEIVRVINASRDITEIEKLQRELEETREMAEKYKKEINRLREQDLRHQTKLIYRSRSMEKVMEQVHKISKFDTTVLITGESGVGKEVVASLIHELSDRAKKPFIKINCGAIPESLLESELCGYDRGAFTGAQKEGKPGLFELAHEGTLFLDEVAELPLSLQVKLLRVLQEKEIRRIGGLRSIPVNIRLIVATNRSLEQLVTEGSFREDLYYRLNVVPIWIPPLRQRTEDIPLLIHHFTVKFNERYGLNKSFSSEVISQLQKEHWKGNVRELQNFVERLIITSDEPVIRSHHLEGLSMNSEFIPFEVKIYDDFPLQQAVEETEKTILKFAKKKYKTTIEIAKALGVDQSTVSRKMRKYGL
jgi:PAS domain S-box-containing protein